MSRRRRGAPRVLAAASLLAALLPAATAQAQAEIERVEIVPLTPGAPGPLSTYRAGQTFSVTFTFSRLLPSSVPGVTAVFDVGGEARSTAPCRSEGRALVCPYTVATRDEDTNGVSVPAPDATYGIRETMVVLPTRPPYAALDDQPGHRVDGVSVGIESFTVTSSPPGGRRAYRAGEVVHATVLFTEEVEAVGGFAPHLLADRPMTTVGGDAQSRDYVFVVAPGDNAAVIEVARLARTLDVEDRHGNRGIHIFDTGDPTGEPVNEADPGVAVDYVAHGAAQSIDTAAPTVVDVRLASTLALYGPGDDIDVTVEFDEPVTVTGDPLLRLEAGSAVKRIALAPGTAREDTRDLTFRWPAAEVAGERLAGNLGVPANALVLVGGGGASAGVVDAAGNPAGNTPAGFEELGARVDSRPPRVLQVDMPADREARVGTALEFGFTFDEPLELDPTDPPSLALTVGAAARTADFLRLAGRKVSFGYTVTRADVDAAAGADGTGRLSSLPGALTVASLRDVAGNAADGDYASPARREIPLARDTADTTPPRLLSVTTDRSLYAAGEEVRFALLFNEAVQLTGNGEFGFVLGNEARRTGTGTVSGPRVLFRYTVQAGDSGPLSWTQGALAAAVSVTDLADNPWPGSVPAGGGAEVDTTAPEVTGVAIESRAVNVRAGGAGGDVHYAKGDRIVVAVTASEAIEVGAGAVLKLRVDDCDPATDGEQGCDRDAIYWSGTGSRRIVFVYRVRETDIDVNGIGVTALAGPLADLAGNPLALGVNGDCDPATSGQTGCGLGIHGIRDAGAHPVYGHVRPAPVPDAPEPEQEPDAVEDGADGDDGEGADGEVTARLVVASTGSGADGSYAEGDTIVLRGEFAAPGANVVRPLTLEFSIGGQRRTVVCAGLGPARLSVECSYRVRSGDEDRDGLVVHLVSGTVVAAGREVMPDLSELDAAALVVDARAPSVVAVEWTTDPGADETYVTGDRIGVAVTFSEAVASDDEVTLPLRVGRTLRRAARTSPPAGQASPRFEFGYTVVAGDEDLDGIAVPALGSGSLVGSVRDPAGHEAVLSHPELADDAAHVVDTRPPTVTAVALVPGGGGVFGLDDTVTVAVSFDEPVAVGPAGAMLALQIGGQTRQAGYVRGSATRRLVFEYVVVAGDDGEIAVEAEAMAGDVTDIGGNPAGGNAAIALGASVDTMAPGIAGAPRLLSAPEGGVYGIGDRIVIGVAFSERVLVTAGSAGPRLAIGIGGGSRDAPYVEGSGSSELRFAYEVAPGDEGGGVAVAANAIELGDGEIRDVNGIAAALRHPAMTAAQGHRVDGVAPAVAGAEFTSRPENADGYLPGERIVAAVRFGEPVRVTGEAVLALVVGDRPRAAACAVAQDGSTLTCAYTVVLGDFDGDGVSLPADALSGAIADTAGNVSANALEELGDDPRHRVLAAPPDVAAGIGPVTLVAGGATSLIDLATVFRGYEPVYAAESSDAAVASVSVANATLTVRSGIEGRATVRVTAANAAGLRETSFDVQVVTDPDETRVLSDALASIARGMLAGTSDLIGARFDLAGTGSSLSLGGRDVTPVRPDAGAAVGTAADGPVPVWPAGTAGATHWSAAGADGSAAGRGSLAGGGGFDLRLGLTGSRAIRWALWGGGNLHGFSGDEGMRSFEGTGATGVVGIDARGETLLAGLAVSRSTAEAEYAFEGETAGGGVLETTFTGVHPYARLAVSEDAEVWVIGGFGNGEAVARRSLTGTESAQQNVALAIAGLRRALPLDFGGASFALRGDAGFLSIAGEEGPRAVDGLGASVSRLRLGMEGGWQLGSTAPFGALSARFDGGDGTTGGGVEVSGGLRIGTPSSRLGLEALGRVVALPFGDMAGDGGISLAAALRPGAGGRGIWLRLAPSWGGSALATDPFREPMPRHLRAHRYANWHERRWGVDAAAGYGLGLRGMPGLVTAFAEAKDAPEGARRLRAGLRYGESQGRRRSRVEVYVERLDGRDGPRARVLLSVSVRG